MKNTSKANWTTREVFNATDCMGRKRVGNRSRELEKNGFCATVRVGIDGKANFFVRGPQGLVVPCTDCASIDDAMEKAQKALDNC